MDNYDIVLDLIEHPDNYSAERISRILSDGEARAIYNVLCKTKSALSDAGEITEAEIAAHWQALSGSVRPVRFGFLRRGSRAASIAVVAVSSLAAVALGVAVTVRVLTANVEGDVPAKAEQIIVSAAPADTGEEVAAEPAQQAGAVVLFEDEPLGGILDAVCRAYSVEVECRNAEAAALHMYYRFNPQLPLSEIVEQLNTFEQIKIRIDGHTLIVE